ncbi:YphA family membrane protein [Bacillus inaquosorum]|uniref:YphA family membrane protein n=1 Tax=Bacillus inaquosorum TaxID=483913 RepID=UPI003D030E14
MEQFYYYWSMWFLWVLTTFIFEKTKRRFAVSVFILTNITLSIHDITLYFPLNAAYMMFFVCGCVYAGYLGMYRFRYLMVFLTLVGGYAFVYLFALYDPVWFIIKPEWVAVILLVLLTASVERDFEKQLTLFVLGMCQGELVYSFVIQKLAGGLAVGGFQWLNACSAGMILLFGISKYEQLASQIGQKSKRSNKGATKMS